MANVCIFIWIQSIEIHKIEYKKNKTNNNEWQKLLILDKHVWNYIYIYTHTHTYIHILSISSDQQSQKLGYASWFFEYGSFFLIIYLFLFLIPYRFLY